VAIQQEQKQKHAALAHLGDTAKAVAEFGRVDGKCDKKTSGLLRAKRKRSASAPPLVGNSSLKDKRTALLQPSFSPAPVSFQISYFLFSLFLFSSYLINIS
jgi:hypothetical protein